MQHGYTVRDTKHAFHVMRHNNRSNIELLGQVGDELINNSCHHWIKPGCWLIIKNNLRIHDMKSVFRIADRIAMLHRGEVLALGSPQEIQRLDDPILKQFVEGEAEGPVQFVQQGKNYLESLTQD